MLQPQLEHSNKRLDCEEGSSFEDSARIQPGKRSQSGHWRPLPRMPSLIAAPQLKHSHARSLPVLTFRTVHCLLALRVVICSCTSSRVQNVNSLLKVLTGRPLPDLAEARSISQSVQLLETNISQYGLLAWRQLDTKLSSKCCPSTMDDLLAKKILPVPPDIEQSQCMRMFDAFRLSTTRPHLYGCICLQLNIVH